MAHLSCGIDFGTSNSSVALAQADTVTLVPVEDKQVTIPSAIFFRPKQHMPALGRAAVQAFFQREPGRFMRSLKRVLGTSLMKQGTMINGRIMRFEDIIIPFLKNLKDRVDQAAGTSVDHVVMGRPVHFIDGDPAGDARAQQELENMARLTGFQHIAFQFEPIAAAFAHEIHIQEEKLALVADLGGGTSDFTVIKLSQRHLQKHSRAEDILGSTGVRVGGNDLDKALTLSALLPSLGYKSTYGSKHLEVPLKPYHDLSEWSKVNQIYNTRLISQLRVMLHESHEKVKLARMLRVMEQETGHGVLAAAESAKIALTDQTLFDAPLTFVEPDLLLPLTQPQFEDCIMEETEKIYSCAKACLQQAQVQPQDITLVILTGGTTEVPAIQRGFRTLFPNAQLADENKLSSVGLGLAYDSLYKFRS